MFDQVLLSQNQSSQYIRYTLSPVSSQSPSVQITKRIKKKTQRNKRLQNMNIGHWTRQEKQKYYYFLHDHQDLFTKKQTRRSDKIFKVMSSEILTRSPDQCRSHHQKMQKRYETINIILQNLEPYYKNQQVLEKKKKQINSGVKEFIIQNSQNSQFKNMAQDDPVEQIEIIDDEKITEDLKQTHHEESLIKSYEISQLEYQIWDQGEQNLDYLNLYEDQIF